MVATSGCRRLLNVAKTLVMHLTTEMKRAAMAYAARLVGRGIDQDAAMDEAQSLARKNLLTLNGFKKKKKKGK